MSDNIFKAPTIASMVKARNEYQQFIESKLHLNTNFGINEHWMPDYLFDFQKMLVEWALKIGRAAIFADCGLGKTLMQLVWAENIVRHTNKNILILTPLAVSHQTLAEAERFGIDASRSNDGKITSKITITNYEKLHKFNYTDFTGIVCDESSILKNFDGARKKEITEFMRRLPYRLLATATAAPNDFIELGTSSEALGYLGFIDMIGRYFKNDNNNIAMNRMFGEVAKFRFKGHAEIPFWRWVSSWAKALRKPSDFGFDDNGFVLHPLKETEHIVKNILPPQGMLFNLPAIRLEEQREEVKRTIKERCELAAQIANNTNDPVFIGCHLIEEGKLLKRLIPDSIEISGSDNDERKEERFISFVDGKSRVLITKPKIGAWGLNFQHCNHIIYFPSHSYEQYYQFTRRCWRFGQKREVSVDLILTEGQQRIMDNLNRKSEQASRMFDNLIKEMNNPILNKLDNKFNKTEEVPSWL